LGVEEEGHAAPQKLARVLLNRVPTFVSRAALMLQVLHRFTDIAVVALIFTVFVGG
jgi:hypothetical protein